MKIKSDKVTLCFECEQCGSTEETSVGEVAYEGAPICIECQENSLTPDIMDLSHCEIDMEED